MFNIINDDFMDQIKGSKENKKKLNVKKDKSKSKNKSKREKKSESERESKSESERESKNKHENKKTNKKNESEFNILNTQKNNFEQYNLPKDLMYEQKIEKPSLSTFANANMSDLYRKARELGIPFGGISRDMLIQKIEKYRK